MVIVWCVGFGSRSDRSCWVNFLDISSRLSDSDCSNGSSSAASSFLAAAGFFMAVMATGFAFMAFMAFMATGRCMPFMAFMATGFAFMAFMAFMAFIALGAIGDQ